MNQAITCTSLYYSEGRSDKEYHAEIIEVAGGNIVNFRYGRRGGTLISGTKTATPVAPAQAKQIYDKLVHDKTSKGYTPAASGSAYQNTAHASRKSDFTPQLLNPVTEAEAIRLIQDDRWSAQQKMDGERRAAHADGNEVFGMNRKGLVVPLPQAIADELQSIALSSGAIRVDGELIGEVLYVFDLHIYQGVHLHSRPWEFRMKLALLALAHCDHIQTVSFARSSTDKFRLWNQVRLTRGEGVVFKRSDAPVTIDRPNSGGDWLKFKFTESASCVVVEVNTGKRSVQIGLFDAANAVSNGGAPNLTPVGNVTIPPNYDVPVAGDIVEVEYLYAYLGGSLYQPVYRGKRTDLDCTECTTQQLKYKPSGALTDEA